MNYRLRGVKRRRNVSAAAALGAAGLAAALTVVLPQAASADANACTAEGYLDTAATSRIAGWARDCDRPGTAIDVHIYVNGTFWRAVHAGDFRPDPALNGTYGFHIDNPGIAAGSRIETYAIGVTADGHSDNNNPPLTNSPQIVGSPDAAENTRPADGTNCEPAFVVNDYANVQGSIGYISAGHCDTRGKAVNSVAEDHDFEIIPLDVNRVNAPTTASGQELRSANYFRAGALDGDAFASTDRSNTAHPTAIGAVNSQICKFGGVTHYRCGTIDRTDYAPSYIAGARDFYLASFACERGDSGSAVLSADGSRAVGIVSGRRIRDGACIISRLDRVYTGSLKLYNAPALDAKYQAYAFLDSKWFAVGQPQVSRDKCLKVAESEARHGVDFRCVPV